MWVRIPPSLPNKNLRYDKYLYGDQINLSIFFTADLHLNHGNIIRHCSRPFNSAREMGNTLIDNWNSVVTKKDEVYVLGDFAWRVSNGYLDEILRRLNGQVHLILGNHDKENRCKRSGFQSIDKLKTIKIEGKKIVLCHYPLVTWDSRIHGSYHLYGHEHGRIENPIPRSMDVGVDAWNYYPIPWEMIKELLSNE